MRLAILLAIVAIAAVYLLRPAKTLLPFDDGPATVHLDVVGVTEDGYAVLYQREVAA